MRDSEYDYPKHQPVRGKDDHGWDEEFEENEDGERVRGREREREREREEEPRYGRRPMHQRERATLPQLPRAHGSKALIAGAIIGALVALEGIFFTLRNADVYKEAANFINDPSKMPAGVAATIFGLAALTFGIGIVLYFIGGLIIGRISVHRRWGFIGGFVGGVVNWIIGMLVQWIPSYPNAGSGGFSGNLLGLSQGIVALIIGAILGGVVAGLFSLLGAWLATRHHPYYVGYSG